MLGVGALTHFIPPAIQCQTLIYYIIFFEHPADTKAELLKTYNLATSMISSCSYSTTRQSTFFSSIALKYVVTSCMINCIYKQLYAYCYKSNLAYSTVNQEKRGNFIVCKQ